MSRAIPGRALEIRYLRNDGQRYKHPFTQPVTMLANRDGSVTLRGRRRIWADDEAPGFSRYLHNPSPRTRRRDPPTSRVPMTSGGFSLSTFVMFILAATLANRIIEERIGGGGNG